MTLPPNPAAYAIFCPLRISVPLIVVTPAIVVLETIGSNKNI